MIIAIIVFIFAVFLKCNTNLAKSDMPMLNYFKNSNKFLLNMFIVGLFAGLVSTLLSCLIGIKSMFVKLTKSNIWQTFLSVLLSLVVGMIDFSVFVSAIYPVVGVINLIIFVFLSPHFCPVVTT